MQLLYALFVSLGINFLLFIPAYLLQTDKLTDFSYGLSFVVLAWAFLFYNDFTLMKLLLALMVTVWGLRLGSYLVIRIRKIKKDKRFDGIRESFFKFLGFWLLQGVSVWVIMIVSLLFFDGPLVIGWLTMIGFATWLFGLVVETIADYQKYWFIENKKNKGKWIDSGLWRYSRHPNYFGEILVWFGIYVFAFSSMIGFERLYALASPMFIAFLIIFVSGLPQLEKGADKKWGHLKAYQEYKQTTSILIPWFT